MGSFGTLTNPAHYVEVPDPLVPGQVKRPAAGAVLKARVYPTSAALADITTTDYGYWSAAYSGVDEIQVSGDNGATWVGPLQSTESLQAAASAGDDATAAVGLANQAVATANQALTTAQNGPAATWDNISGKPVTFPPSAHSHTATQLSDSTPTGRSLMTAPDPQAARAAIGAGTGNGTSNLQLGTTATTAAPGNHAHSASAVAFTPVPGLTATDVQGAIVQAAASGGGSGGSEIHPVLYVSGAYQSLPAAPDASWKVVEYTGPTPPSPPYTVPAYSGIKFRWVVESAP